MQPGDLQDYLRGIVNGLGELGGSFIVEPAIEIDPGRGLGTLRAELAFVPGQRLMVSLVVSGPELFPDWLDYSFHLMDGDDHCIFRYDSAPYHSTAYFPHHKHVGPDETVVDAPRPSLAQVIEEVRTHVYR